MFANAIVAAALTFSAATGGSAELDEATQTPAHEPWPISMTCEHNGVAGDGGYVCTEDGIPHDHECLIHISMQPYRAIVVRDSSVLCEAEAVEGTSFQGVSVPEDATAIKENFWAAFAEDGASVDADFYDDYDPSYEIDANHNGVSDKFERATSGCTTDADCAAWERAHGLPNGGYTAGK